MIVHVKLTRCKFCLEVDLNETFSLVAKAVLKALRLDHKHSESFLNLRSGKGSVFDGVHDALLGLCGGRLSRPYVFMVAHASGKRKFLSQKVMVTTNVLVVTIKLYVLSD